VAGVAPHGRMGGTWREEGEQMCSAAGQNSGVRIHLLLFLFLSSKIKKEISLAFQLSAFQGIRSVAFIIIRGKKYLSPFVFPVENFTGLCQGNATSVSPKEKKKVVLQVH
jgi:hypothetical protein